MIISGFGFSLFLSNSADDQWKLKTSRRACVPPPHMRLVSYLQEQDQEAELAKGFPSTPQIYEVYNLPQIIHTGLNYLKIIKIQLQKSSAALCGELAAMPQGQLKLRTFVLHLPWLWHDDVCKD